jgi:hypothetical protein
VDAGRANSLALDVALLGHFRAAHFPHTRRRKPSQWRIVEPRCVAGLPQRGQVKRFMA